MLDHGVWVRAKYRAQDNFIRREIFDQDDYRVRSLGWVPEVVFDIGAHCGFFSRLASQLWPSARIIAVEPVAENAAVARLNCPQATIIEAACTYDPEPIRLRVTIDQQEHTGGSHVAHDGERIVARVTLDELLDSRDVLLKLDCENSELSILRHSQHLSKVRTIVGEWHSRNDFLSLVQECLPNWTLTVYRDANIGLFRLDRP